MISYVQITIQAVVLQGVGVNRLGVNKRECEACRSSLYLRRITQAIYISLLICQLHHQGQSFQPYVFLKLLKT